LNSKLVIFSAQGENSFSLAQRQLLTRAAACEFIPQLEPISADQFGRYVADADWVAFTRRLTRDFGAAYVRELHRVRGIAVYSTGCEWLDLHSLNRKGVAVSHIPDYSTISVAEHTLAMLLVLSRRIHLSTDRSRGLIGKHVSLRGWELRGKTVGIIGFGNIGKAVMDLLQAFGCRVIVHDPAINSPDSSVPTRSIPLEQLIEQSDVLCLTASKQRDAAPVLTREVLKAAKLGIYVINPSRASLVDNDAIVEGIRAGAIAGYAVDDYQEALNDARIEPGRILQTGHTAWYSDEAMLRGTDAWVENITALISNRPQNLVSEEL